MPFGTELTPEGVRFRIYAPAAGQIRLVRGGTEEALQLQKREDGWHELVTPKAQAGSRYQYQLPDGTIIPDPASRFQPEDVAGPGEVIDPATFTWTDYEWRGRPWSQAILYEMHIGAFTPEGTFRAATEKLDYLADLGITAIELMTITDFAGTRGWGYDTVLPFAPDSAYGRPDDLKAFINAAHARGLQVIFDVVYNHFGPEGNYLPKYFPQICSAEHDTAWGKGFNFDGPGSEQVRAFFLHNALFWVEEYHADGLRLDASHMIIDHSPKHILDEIAEAVRAAAPGREVHLILEDEENVSPRLARTPDGATPLYTAQWNHDMSHLLSAAFGNLCPDRDGNGDETEDAALMLAEGYVLTPTAKEHPDELRCKVPPSAFIAYLQTHDLIGNRTAAERLDKLVPHPALRAATAIMLLLPQTPMLFMGQEWAASQPFPFFCDYHGDLAGKIRSGRCDFLHSLHNTDDLSAAPDPGAESTFRSAHLDWNELDQEPHKTELDWFRRILAVRRDRLMPLLQNVKDRCGKHTRLSPATFTITWHLGKDHTLTLQANLCDQSHDGFPPPEGEILWLEGTQQTPTQLGPWSALWTLA